MKGKTIDITTLEQGTDFMAVVNIRSLISRYYTNLALTQIFPSGWEIVNYRMAEVPSEYKSSSFSYQDIRDDRVYTYFDLNWGDNKTFYVKLTSAYQGKFYLPGFNCEAMYDGTVNARNTGRWVEVTDK
jgi:uncharacterized protein YfaS (alpha-2-macroglobulin family)